MSKCNKCGVGCDDALKICPHCGASLDDGGVQSNVDGAGATVEERLMAIFSYLGLLFLVPLFVGANSKYVRYHANQGLTLFICEVVIAIFSTILWVISHTGRIFSLAICLPLYLVTVVFMVVGIVHAVGGETTGLPIIGKIKILD